MATRKDPISDGSTTPTSSWEPVSDRRDINGTNNGTHMIDYYKDAQISFLVILFFLIVIGNVIVLAAIALSKERRRSRMNFFIMHLALCDLLTGPLIVLSEVIEKITEYWYAGEAFCKISRFSNLSVMYASTFMLVALSIDRLDAVARPLQFTGSWVRVKVLVCLAWILSFVFAFPQLFIATVDYSFGGPACVRLLPEGTWKIYVVLSAFSIFFIPALIILVCYLWIIVLIFNSSSLVSSVSKTKGGSKDEELLRENTSHGQRNVSAQSSRGIIPQAKVRTIKMTFIIVLVFILCWSPYFILNLYDMYAFDSVQRPKTWRKIMIFVQSLAPLNSAANPLIYGVFSTRICRYIRRGPSVQRVPTSMRKCCLNSSPTPRASTADYTSISETEDFRLTGDLRNSGSQNGIIRVPLVKQQLTEADRELLSLHVRKSTDVDP